ncbi:uncharacterized protein [Procambarus clarkii]|uniref:uncharacterized protein n=1 Tax=Procambarus clarkii TaxID=6728 RepID=UPI001E672A0C|nr:uncharacterized protein LOC123772835 isoform X1 [Procambarus clarkii]XP_045622125.1 uncharacterized protein LOC123772835 isoform X2 [Procambarus clarkii]XP_045622126.1 uncharacterized protein LOC123772835 isoform X1 [Procambarus clarkii]
MMSRLLKLLSWMGLWSAPLVVLNANAPPTELTPTPTQMVEMTSKFMNILLDNFVTEEGKKVSYLALEHSSLYTTNFQEFGSLLKRVDPLAMNATERKSFFINLYNLLTIHALVSMTSLPTSTVSVTDFWRRYAYQVGPFTLHLDDLEHGVLRGNRPHPTTNTVFFKDGDPRLALSVPADHRIHAALNCGALGCSPLASYSPGDQELEQDLDDAMQRLCNTSVTRVNHNSIVINSIFQWFSSDFADTEKLTLRFLADCIQDSAMKALVSRAAAGEVAYTYHYDWTLNAVSGAGGAPLKLVVYFESLCPDSVRFFKRQLYPTWRDLKDIIHLEFVPFGKARATPTGTGDYEFECQHGPDECHGNKVMACAQDSLPIDTQVEFFNCMMSKSYPATTGQECSKTVGIEWAPIRECSESEVGSTLLYKNGIRTAELEPPVRFIPTITIDGHYNNHQLRSSLKDLKSQVCNMFQGPPHHNCSGN